MWAWNATTLEVIGFQDLKGRATLFDLDTTGEFVAYAVEKRGGYWSYVGVSRPPYFHALFLANAGLHPSVVFNHESIIVRRSAGMMNWGWSVEERVEAGCPYTIIDDTGKLGPLPPLWDRLIEFIGVNPSTPICTWSDRSYWRVRSAPCRDVNGRQIWSDSRHVYADETPFLDLARQPFTEVVPPEWAKSWIAPRK